MNKKISPKLGILAIVISGLFIAPNIFSQVTIGSAIAPKKGAILDIKQEEKADGSANSTKGLGLPRVALESISKLEPCVATDATSRQDHIGLTVYNTTDNSGNSALTEEALTEGVYAWDGNVWSKYTGGSKGVALDAENGLKVIDGKVVLGGDLTQATTIKGDATKTLTLDAPTNISKNLTVAGATTLTGDLISNGVTTLKDMTVTGDMAISGITQTATSTVTGNETIGGTLDVTGATTLKGNLTANGVITLKNTTVNGNITVTGMTKMAGATVTGNQTIGGTLGITGATNLAGNLTANGATTLNATTTINVNTTGKSLVINDGKASKNGKFLMAMDDTGRAEWQPLGAVSTTDPVSFGAGIKYDPTATTYKNTNSSIDLPPGRWLVQCAFLFVVDTVSPVNSSNPNFYSHWVQIRMMDGAYQAGNSLVSGNISKTQKYNSVSGYFVISNKTNKKVTYNFTVTASAGEGYNWPAGSLVECFAKNNGENTVVAMSLAE